MPRILFRKLTGAAALLAFLVVAGTAPADQGKASPAPKETKEIKEAEQKEKKPEASSPAPAPPVPAPPPVPQPPLPSNPLPLQVPPVPKVEPKPEKPCPPASGEQKKSEKSAEEPAPGNGKTAPCQPADPPTPK